MTAIPLPLPINSSPASNQATAVINQTTTLQVADDKDVIEPEWVHKAKAIVNSTIEDPYKQSEDLTVLKADYMQKRYNKIVKLK
jgi:general stress protein 26